MSSGIQPIDRKSTRLNSSHTEIYTLSLHDALPIYVPRKEEARIAPEEIQVGVTGRSQERGGDVLRDPADRSEEHTSELQSHRDLHSFPTRRSSDLCATQRRSPDRARRNSGWSNRAFSGTWRRCPPGSSR